jgi:4-amino-4-deoxy-L-arabinose transferase-like glycosyltransferase
MQRSLGIAEATRDSAEGRDTRDRAGPGTWVGLVIVCAISGAVCFFHLGAYGLWEPDEARYAEIAREMVVLRNYLVPHLNYVPYIEKPPLLYWLTAGAMHLFGINEFAARFVNASAALVGAIATYIFAHRWFGYRQALCASAMLSTSALYGVMSQVLTTDMLPTSLLTIALFAFYLHWREGGRWCWLMYTSAGLAVLTKGPIGIVVPAVVGTVFLAVERDLSSLVRRFHLIGGAVLVIVITAPWFISISIRQPDFIEFYFVGEHFRRFFEASYSHGEPIYYYVPWILAGALPWSLFAVFVPWRSMDPDPARRFCLVAVGVIFTIFSLASGKLIPYILPAMPPLMIVIADGAIWVVDHFAYSRRFAGAGIVFILAGIGLAGASAHHFASPYPSMIHTELITGSVVLLIVGIVLQIQRPVVGIYATMVGSLAILLVASYGRIALEPTRSYAELARRIAIRASNARLICYPRYIQSLPFYTGKRVILIGAKTELDYGYHHAADADHFFFTRRADLLRLWREPQKTILIVDRPAFAPLAPALGQYQVVAEDTKKIAIANWVDQASPAA